MPCNRCLKGVAVTAPDFDGEIREVKLTPVAYWENAPGTILENPERYYYMLARDKVTAGFSDYALWLKNYTLL
jgi:hypothetical protein